MSFERKRGIMCMLHRLAEEIWPCKLDQINEDHKENWYQLAQKARSANSTWIRVL